MQPCPQEGPGPCDKRKSFVEYRWEQELTKLWEVKVFLQRGQPGKDPDF